MAAWRDGAYRVQVVGWAIGAPTCQPNAEAKGDEVTIALPELLDSTVLQREEGI